MNALFALVLGAAHAGPLVPRWPVEPVSYQLETVIDTPRSTRHVGSKNVEARSTRLRVTAEVTCTGQLSGKKWQVRCDVDGITFQGRSATGTGEALQAIFNEYQSMLANAAVELSIADNGRITGLKMDGVEKTDARTGEMLETLHLVFRRLFAPMDLQLPKNGDAKGKSWRQRGSPMALELMTRFGTAGGMVLDHEVTAQDGAMFDIGSKGRGGVTSGDTLEAGAGALMRIQTTGRGRFDSADGVIIWRQIGTNARFTVSAFDSGPGKTDYAHIAGMVRIRSDGTLESPPAVTAP
jgi:hypothetical protein